MTILSTFHHKDSFKWIDYHFQSIVFNLNIFREWGREWRGERNKLNNNMISSWIIFISTWWKLWIFIIEFIQFAEWYWGISLFFFLVNWNESFLFNLTIIFYFIRAVKHFRLWSHHRHLKSRQMNRLFLSINYLQFISSWDWGRGRVCKKGVRRWIKFEEITWYQV